MIKLWFLSAVAVWFANMSHQNIQSERVRSGASYYSLSDQFSYEDDQNTKVHFKINGSTGVGLTLLTQNIDALRWRHTLTLKHYPTPDYQISVYQTGLEYITFRKERTLQQFIGFDLSIANMDLTTLSEHGAMQESFGYGAHVGIEGYFVTWERLAHYFISAGLRRQPFIFESKYTSNQTFNGNGSELNAGLGFKF